MHALSFLFTALSLACHASALHVRSVNATTTSGGLTSSSFGTSGSMTMSSSPSMTMSSSATMTMSASNSTNTWPPTSALSGNSTGTSTISSLSNPFTTMTTVTSNSLTQNLTAPPTTVVTPNPTATPITHGEYYLRVKALPGQDTHYNGMYLAAWQTGANTSDAVFTRNKTDGLKFYLNGTVEMVDFGTSGLPWAMEMTLDAAFDQWQPVTFGLGTGNGYGSYWVNETGLQWTPCLTPPPHTNHWQQVWDAYFGGWRVCKWWHGLPQLFYDISYLHPIDVNSCADVMLVLEYFKH